MMKRKPKLTLSAIVLALLIGASGFWIDREIRSAELERFSQKFALLGTLRKSALETYLDTVRGEMTFWSVSPRLQSASIELQQGWSALGAEKPSTLQQLYLHDSPYPLGERRLLDDAGDGSAYSAAHKALHTLATDFVTNRGYYDFFLIDPAGNIVYSVEKEADFATSLNQGPYRDTGLGKVFRAALADPDHAVHLSDLERYEPSNQAPAIFMARKMIADDASTVGVLALQLPTSRIIDIMQFTEGMGTSGETYLVGEDLLMRSDSRFSEDSTILRTRVDTRTVHQALQGETGISFTPDYRGISVLSAFDSINIGDFRWAVMAEIDAAEVHAETEGLGAVVFGLGTLLYGFALWTLTVLSRVVLPDSGSGQVLPDIDVGQA